MTAPKTNGCGVWGVRALVNDAAAEANPTPSPTSTAATAESESMTSIARAITMVVTAEQQSGTT